MNAPLKFSHASKYNIRQKLDVVPVCSSVFVQFFIFVFDKIIQGDGRIGVNTDKVSVFPCFGLHQSNSYPVWSINLTKKKTPDVFTTYIRCLHAGSSRARMGWVWRSEIVSFSHCSLANILLSRVSSSLT